MLLEETVLTQGQAVEPDLPGEVLFGERWPLIGQMRLVANELDAARKPLFTQGFDALRSGLARAHQNDSPVHDGPKDRQTVRSAPLAGATLTELRHNGALASAHARR